MRVYLFGTWRNVPIYTAYYGLIWTDTRIEVDDIRAIEILLELD